MPSVTPPPLLPTIHEDSAAYEILTSSMTMEMESVTHALCWIASISDKQTTHAVILTDSFLRILWVYSPGHAGVRGK